MLRILRHLFHSRRMPDKEVCGIVLAYCFLLLKARSIECPSCSRINIFWDARYSPGHRCMTYCPCDTFILKASSRGAQTSWNCELWTGYASLIRNCLQALTCRILTLQGEIFGDSSRQMWTLSLSEFEKYDKEITARWNEDTNGVLVFVGPLLLARRSELTVCDRLVYSLRRSQHSSSRDISGSLLTRATRRLRCSAKCHNNSLGFRMGKSYPSPYP